MLLHWCSNLGVIINRLTANRISSYLPLRPQMEETTEERTKGASRQHLSCVPGFVCSNSCIRMCEIGGKHEPVVKVSAVKQEA